MKGSTKVEFEVGGLPMFFETGVLAKQADITKIGPIKRFENLPNGIGIMADDIVAGLFALVTQAAILTSLNQTIYIKTLWN